MMMKNLILTTTLLLVASITFGQTLQKGNLVGVHVMNVDLKPDFTMDQVKRYYVEKGIPEFEKHFAGVKLFLLDAIRGEHKNSLGLLYFFESEALRDKFYNANGYFTELGASAWEKLNPVIAEIEKFGTWSRKYTDWMIE